MDARSGEDDPSLGLGMVKPRQRRRETRTAQRRICVGPDGEKAGLPYGFPWWRRNRMETEQWRRHLPLERRAACIGPFLAVAWPSRGRAAPEADEATDTDGLRRRRLKKGRGKE
jgi:hypothetical protein